MTETITVAEAATRLGVSKQAVLGLIRRGTVPATVEGREKRYLVDRRAVERRAAQAVEVEGWATIPTAAEARGIDPTTLRDWVRSGHVNSVSTPKGRIVELNEVLAATKRRTGPRGARQ